MPSPRLGHRDPAQLGHALEELEQRRRARAAAPASRSAASRAGLGLERASRSSRRPAPRLGPVLLAALKRPSSRLTSAASASRLSISARIWSSRAADLPLHALDLVEHGRVFLVGLHVHELALVLGPLGLEVLELRPRAAGGTSGRRRGRSRAASRRPRSAAEPRLRARLAAAGIAASSASTRRSSLSACWRRTRLSRSGFIGARILAPPAGRSGNRAARRAVDSGTASGSLRGAARLDEAYRDASWSRRPRLDSPGIGA